MDRLAGCLITWRRGKGRVIIFVFTSLRSCPGGEPRRSFMNVLCNQCRPYDIHKVPWTCSVFAHVFRDPSS